MELIRLEDITKTYHLGEQDVPVLKGVSLTIRRGEMVALMGVSGSGKTTLMNTLGCLDRPSSGHYWLDGEEISGLSPEERAVVRNRKIGFVFQNFNLLPRTDALDNAQMPLQYNAQAPGDRECGRRAQALLERVGLGDRLTHEPSQLSGGQQQRVAIARALVNQPALLLADEPTGNLDTKTSQEILQMFKKLNVEEGITIILVTHDPDVASHAQRVIHIRDGLIVESEGIDGGPSSAPASVPATPDLESLNAVADPSPRPRGASPWGVMRFFFRTLRTSLHALRRNVLRSALTTLGIIIGVAAVIAMVEIGQGSATAIQQQIASMGANILLVLPGTASSGGVSLGLGTVKTLTPQDAEAILQDCPAVRAVAPVVRAHSQVVYGNRNWIPLNIMGTTPAFLTVRDWEDLAEGEAFTDADVRKGAHVCLLGQTLVRELFPGKSPLGEEVRVQNVALRVVGVLSRKGANMVGIDQDDVLVAPWTTIRNRISGMSPMTPGQASATTDPTQTKVNSVNQFYPGSAPSPYPAPSASQLANTPQPVRFDCLDQVLVGVASPSEIPLALTQITELLHDRHRIHADQPDDFTLHDMTEITKALAMTVHLLAGLLLCVALISLAVGGVGIMNIMLVSVTERTREIGLRMAVGARATDILRQFLVEAVVLCLLGGAVGILVGRGGSYLVQVLLEWPTETSPAALIAAVAVSATVGVVFGYYPAWKASRLDPIEALRYE
jgi:macrolide transport system ATP-binding/permease protein